mmetsp:Transcript_5303/g.9670  ORF Transcript_5303/g.9670 Transcript_5303/m.9670 type:complete len:90 (-) Transcript_5303:36-305(-)
MGGGSGIGNGIEHFAHGRLKLPSDAADDQSRRGRKGGQYQFGRVDRQAYFLVVRLRMYARVRVRVLKKKGERRISHARDICRGDGRRAT